MSSKGGNKLGWQRTALFCVAAIFVLSGLESPLPEKIAKDLFGIDASAVFFRGVRDAVPALVVALILTLTYERARDLTLGNRIEGLTSTLEGSISDVEVASDELLARINEQMARATPRARVTDALQSVIGRAGQISDLVSLIYPADRPFFTDVHSTFRLSSGANADEWTVENGYQFEVVGVDEVLVVLCVGIEKARYIHSILPSAVHVEHFDDNDGLLATRRYFLDTASALTVATASGDGDFGARAMVRLRSVSSVEYARYGLEASFTSHDEICLLVGALPSAVQPRRQVSLRTMGSLSAGSGRCSYLEDRPAFVRSITFDWTGVAHADNLDFRVSAFYAAKGPEPVVRDGGRRIEMDVNAWLVAGQGAQLTWMPKIQ